jgi:hypothetical protein
VYKSFRIEESLLELAKLVAGCEGKNLSQVLRELLGKYISERLSYAKARIKEALDVLSQIEKAPNEEFLTKAQVTAAVYPIPNAPIEYYVEVERRLAAVNKLVEKGFDFDFAEELVQKYFGEQGVEFRKGLERFSEGAITDWERSEAKRAISKRLRQEGDQSE